MINRNVDIDIKKALALNEQKLNDRLVLAGEHVVTTIKTYMKNLPNPTKRDPGKIGLIDTGRARDSVSWATMTQKSNIGPKAKQEDRVHSPSEKLTLNVGSAVEYFIWLEIQARYAPIRVGLTKSKRGIKYIFSK